jgi:hypothetical protein
VLVVSSFVVPGWGVGGLHVERGRGRVRRRPGWVVLTRTPVVYAPFDGVHVGVHDAMLFEPVVALPVPNEGKRRWGWLTLGSLDLSLDLPVSFSLVIFISGLTNLLSTSLFSAVAIPLVLVEFG